MNASKAFKRIFDVVVVGGGHAGCEAAAAAARMGARTALLTHRKDTIGEMSCNPSFGGIGKGHLVREVDGMDGLCGRICDKSAITYQALNLTKGPAVLGLRAQIDREIYKKHMQEELINSTPNLTVLEGCVEDISLQQSTSSDLPQVCGVLLVTGELFQQIMAEAIVITTGTFLGGEIYWGHTRLSSFGRLGDESSSTLSETFSHLGFKLGRLRTGTPPRLLKSTIDFSKFKASPPDANPIPFSFLTEKVWLDPCDQLPTYLSYTNDEVAALVRKNYHESEYIRSTVHGPRYCPSLEAKILRFQNMYHKLFLEHEGLDSELIYPQGMSMTFTTDVQQQIMRAIPGLEQVEIAQTGYGVEYDFVNPQQLYNTLETKLVEKLFLAGQINGTTGYEEAAAQGILAGINAAAVVLNKDPLIVNRTEGYIGVLVDDLTSLGTNEPYRMFTSRAEFRMHLRPDNADIRLTEKANSVGAVSDLRYAKFKHMKKNLESLSAHLKSVTFTAGEWANYIPRLGTTRMYKVYTAYDLLHCHNVTLSELKKCCEIPETDIHSELELRLRNEGLYERMYKLMIAKMEEIRRESGIRIPDEINYSEIAGLSYECIEKFTQWRPQNLAAASRVPGVTPNALASLLRYIKQKQLKEVRRIPQKEFKEFDPPEKHNIKQ